MDRRICWYSLENCLEEDTHEACVIALSYLVDARNEDGYPDAQQERGNELDLTTPLSQIFFERINNVPGSHLDLTTVPSPVVVDQSEPDSNLDLTGTTSRDVLEKLVKKTEPNLSRGKHRGKQRQNSGPAAPYLRPDRTNPSYVDRSYIARRRNKSHASKKDDNGEEKPLNPDHQRVRIKSEPGVKLESQQPQEVLPQVKSEPSITIKPTDSGQDIRSLETIGQQVVQYSTGLIQETLDRFKRDSYGEIENEIAALCKQHSDKIEELDRRKTELYNEVDKEFRGLHDTLRSKIEHLDSQIGDLLRESKNIAVNLETAQGGVDGFLVKTKVEVNKLRENYHLLSDKSTAENEDIRALRNQYLNTSKAIGELKERLFNQDEWQRKLNVRVDEIDRKTTNQEERTSRTTEQTTLQREEALKALTNRYDQRYDDLNSRLEDMVGQKEVEVLIQDQLERELVKLANERKETLIGLEQHEDRLYNDLGTRLEDKVDRKEFETLKIQNLKDSQGRELILEQLKTLKEREDQRYDDLNLRLKDKVDQKQFENLKIQNSMKVDRLAIEQKETSKLLRENKVREDQRNADLIQRLDTKVDRRLFEELKTSNNDGQREELRNFLTDLTRQHAGDASKLDELLLHKDGHVDETLVDTLWHTNELVARLSEIVAMVGNLIVITPSSEVLKDIKDNVSAQAVATDDMRLDVIDRLDSVEKDIKTAAGGQVEKLRNVLEDIKHDISGFRARVVNADTGSEMIDRLKDIMRSIDDIRPNKPCGNNDEDQKRKRSIDCCEELKELVTSLRAEVKLSNQHKHLLDASFAKTKLHFNAVPNAESLLDGRVEYQMEPSMEPCRENDLSDFLRLWNTSWSPVIRVSVKDTFSKLCSLAPRVVQNCAEFVSHMHTMNSNRIFDKRFLVCQCLNKRMFVFKTGPRYVYPYFRLVDIPETSSASVTNAVVFFRLCIRNDFGDIVSDLGCRRALLAATPSNSSWWISDEFHYMTSGGEPVFPQCAIYPDLDRFFYPYENPRYYGYLEAEPGHYFDMTDFFYSKLSPINAFQGYNMGRIEIVRDVDRFDMFATRAITRDKLYIPRGDSLRTADDDDPLYFTGYAEALNAEKKAKQRNQMAKATLRGHVGTLLNAVSVQIRNYNTSLAMGLDIGVDEREIYSTVNSLVRIFEFVALDDQQSASLLKKELLKTLDSVGQPGLKDAVRQIIAQ